MFFRNRVNQNATFKPTSLRNNAEGTIENICEMNVIPSQLFAPRS